MPDQVEMDVKEDHLPPNAPPEGRRLHSEAPVTGFSKDQTVVAMSKNNETQQGCCYHFLLNLSWCMVCLIPLYWCCAFITVKEYVRIILFRMGKLVGVAGPGLVTINPITDSIREVDLRIRPCNVPAQNMMTKDTVTVSVNCIVYIKVIDPLKAILEVDNHIMASEQFAATSLRSVVGANDLEALLINRDDVNQQLREIIEHETSKWGVIVTAVEIKDVVLPQNMQRAMASEAEQERERRAKIINARGEKEAAIELAAAAETINKAPGAMQLRYMHTLTNISVEKNSTIIFPLPIDLMDGIKALSQLRGNNGGDAEDGRVGGYGASAPSVHGQTSPM